MQQIPYRQTSQLAPHKQLISQRINHQKLFNPKIQKSYPRQFKSLNVSLSEVAALNRQDKSNDIYKKLSESFQGNQDHQIYFNRNKKYNYMKNIIDKYFQETKRDKWYQQQKNNPEQLNLAKNYATISYRVNLKDNKKSIKPEDLKNNNKPSLQLIRKNRTISLRESEEDLANNLTQSRLIVQDKLQSQLQTNGAQSLSFTVKNSINLPRIDQMLEDKEDQLQNMRYQSISYINESQSDFIKESKIRMIQNEIYFIEIVLKNGRPTHRIKTFKDKGQPILSREIKAASMGVQSIWIEYKFDPRSLISNPSYSIKELLFKARKVDADSKFYTLKTKKYYKKLTTNNCQELKRILRQFCTFMKKFEGKILNNKINTGNLYIAKNQNFRLGQWGFSSFRETHLIQSMEFQNRIQPIIKSQKEWFVPPEYLAPQIIRALAFQEQVNLMEKGSAADIWSLGVTLFQIFTVIPVWIPQKCMIHGKIIPPRQGILAVGDRDLKKLLKREEKLPYLMKKVFEQEFGQQKFSTQILDIILRCVDYNPANRMTLDQILQTLK